MPTIVIGFIIMFTNSFVSFTLCDIVYVSCEPVFNSSVGLSYILYLTGCAGDQVDQIIAVASYIGHCGVFPASDLAFYFACLV